MAGTVGVDRHPKGLYPLFFTEMWERFSYYLMIGILYQYLVDYEKGGMGWSGAEAAGVVGSYVALVYFTPFLGGLIADRLLGNRTTILIGAVLMMIGHVALAFPGAIGLYVGLAFLIIGNGAFKPNISTLLGNLYPDGSPLKDRGYNIFYMGINIGAFVCNFAAALVRNQWGWHAAFATAGVGMLIGLVIFSSTWKLYSDADKPAPRVAGETNPILPLFAFCLVPAAVLATLGWATVWFFGLDLKPANVAFLLACIPAVGFFVWVWLGVKDKVERGRVGALLVVFGIVVVFWSIFTQASTALSDWAVDSTDRRFEWMASAPVLDQFTEYAPPSYFENADPSTPRPDPSAFQVVSEDEYKAAEEAQTLVVKPGVPMLVTQERFDSIYQHATPQTPVLPKGDLLQVANAELYQSINPFWVIVFTPLLVALWQFLASRKQEPSTPAKIGFGMVLTALSPAVMLIAVLWTHDASIKASSLWLVETYAVITLGELCLSPMGLALVSKTAPARIRAFMMGGWFLSHSIGNKLSGFFGEAYHYTRHDYFYVGMVLLPAIAALVIFLLLPMLRRHTDASPVTTNAPGGQPQPAPH